MLLLLLLLLFPEFAHAGPSSPNFELQEYSFGAGGTDTTFSSTNYGLFGLTGQVESLNLQSSNYQANTGLIYILQSGVPPAPILSNNNAKYYNKLHITINYSTAYGSIPSDILFAIAVSTDNFVADTKYVQADQTLGSSPVWQSYTTWGGTSGFDILGLTKDTIYYAKISAKQGNFTQSPFGPVATLPTAENNTLSFDLLTNSLPLGSLIPNTIITSSTQAEINLSTNSNSGALVYIFGSNAGLKSSAAGNYTITTVTGSQDLTNLSQGYGLRSYSTQQSSGLLVASEPYNGTGNTVGQVDSDKRILYTTNDAPLESGIGKFEIRAKSSLTTPPASDYSDTLTVLVAGTF